MTINVKVEVLEDGFMPERHTDESAGFDLRSGHAIRLPSGSAMRIPCRIRLEIPKGFEGQIRPRSGLAYKKGLTILNSPGTIDSDYRGEVQLLIVNHGNKVIELHKGARIAQLVIKEVPKVKLVEKKKLNTTKRGDKGFGSTGITDKKKD